MKTAVFGGTLPDEQTPRKSRDNHSSAQDEISRLRAELASADRQLRSLKAEHKAAKAQMQSFQAEILEINKNLKRSNERFAAVNETLKQRNSELTRLTLDLNNLLEGIDIPAVVLDASLCIRTFTQPAEALFNLIPADVGRPLTDLRSGISITDWKTLLAEVTSEGHPLEREVSDREGRRYSLRLRPYRDANNAIAGVLVMAVETETIHRALDQAQQSGDFARATVETVRQALTVVDSELRVLSVNRSFCELFRVTPQEVEGQPLFGSGKGKLHAPQFERAIRETLAEHHTVKGFDLELEFPGVGIRDLVLDARPVNTSRTVLIAIEDVTDRKLAQREVHRSEATVRALLEASIQSIVAVNADGTIVLANGSTESMFGYRREEMLGQKLDLLVPEPFRGRHREYHLEFFRNPKSRPMGSGPELFARRKDGTTFTVEIGLSFIDTAGQRLAVAFISDISGRKRLEKEAQTHAAEVQALAASLLTAQEQERRRVSRELHDQICQQLASLAIDIGGIAVEPQLSKGMRERLKTLQTRVVQASEGARHLAYDLHPSVLDDLGLVAALRALCKDFSVKEGIAIECSAGPVPGPVPREAAACLYRIAQEGLQNVAQHSGANNVTVTLSSADGNAHLSIADDGCGFDVDAVKGQGGLGLISMEERARMVRGKLIIESKLGKGTRIALDVPLPGPVNGRLPASEYETSSNPIG